MSNYNSIEKIISAEILRTNEDNLIANKICNTNFAGEIKNAGDSVVFIGMNEPTVSNYTGTLSYDTTQDSAVTLDINQDKVFAFKIKNLEELRSSIGLRDSQTKRASYNLKKEVDTYVLGLWGDAANQMDPVDATPANVLSIIAQLKEKLEEANVPDGQSWIVIPPFLKAQLVIAGVKFQINNGINGTGMIGYTNELGCDLFVSNQLAASGGKTVCLAGSYSAIAYAEQVLETQVIDRLENSFDTAIRGRIVFGAKVIKPNELVACPVGNGGYSI